MLSNTNFDQRSYGAYKGSSRTYVTARQAYMSASVVEVGFYLMPFHYSPPDFWHENAAYISDCHVIHKSFAMTMMDSKHHGNPVVSVYSTRPRYGCVSGMQGWIRRSPKGWAGITVLRMNLPMGVLQLQAASPMLSGPPAPVVSPPAAPSAAAQLPKGSKKMSKFAVGFIKPFRSKANTQNQH